jgi:Cu2+-exporting ATPase
VPPKGYLERLRKIGTVLLDKTGTLTEGRASVGRWQGEDAALQFARALEAQSAHAVARAFQRSFGRPMWLVRAVENVVEVPGQGIAGRLDGHDVRIGNRLHVEAAGAVVPAHIAAAAVGFVADGLSPVFVALDGVVQGVAGIGDRLRADAGHTVAVLRARGIRVRILSGDHPEIVARVASELGLPSADAIGGLTPEAKRDIIAGLVGADGKAGALPHSLGTGCACVVMVGDGANDAAALALADVGIAVHGGTGATIAASDIVLIREGVAPLLEILDGARRLRGVIRRNLGFSLLYNAGAAALAIAGFVSPLVAALLMPCSSLVVVLSSVVTRTFGGTADRRGANSGEGNAGAFPYTWGSRTEG